MKISKSFWTWFINGIRIGLYGILTLTYKYWYGLFIYIGAGITFMSSMNAWWEYRNPPWVSVDIGLGYFAEPKVMPWMILYPILGVVIFMFGLYGYWRKNIRTSEQKSKEVGGSR
ncbi:MAG: hypothetical protein HWN68_19015 [Desulfobacterales bacterium]|nr:hypothetical protein [Desulfobacterales bacterium]